MEKVVIRATATVTLEFYIDVEDIDKIPKMNEIIQSGIMDNLNSKPFLLKDKIEYCAQWKSVGETQTKVVTNAIKFIMDEDES